MNVRLQPDLIWRLEQIAVDLGMSTTDLVHTAILKGLDRLEMQSGLGLQVPLSAPPGTAPVPDAVSSGGLGGKC